MSQITGNNNLFHTYKMDLKDDLKRDISTIDRIIEIVSKNKAKTLNVGAKGFVPYSFEYGEEINLNKDIKESKVRDMLIVKHYEKNKKQRKDPALLLQAVEQPDVSKEIKKQLEKMIETSYYTTYQQDIIFIPRKEITVIFPANNRDDVLKWQLNPYFESFFEFNLDPINRKITQDVLKWLVWKVKKSDEGKICDSLSISDIYKYDSAAHLTTGRVQIEMEGIDDNNYAKLSMASGEECHAVGLSVVHNGEEFNFKLHTEGSYTPSWSQMNTLAYADNSRANRIIILEKISMEIIPKIYHYYKQDQEKWDSMKDELMDINAHEVKESLTISE